MHDHQPSDQARPEHGSPPEDRAVARTAAALGLGRGYVSAMLACGLAAVIVGLAVLANSAAGAKPVSHHHARSRTANVAVAYVRARMLAAEENQDTFISMSTSTFSPNEATAPSPGEPAPQGAIAAYTNRTWFDPVTDAQLSEHITAPGDRKRDRRDAHHNPGY